MKFSFASSYQIASAATGETLLKYSLSGLYVGSITLEFSSKASRLLVVDYLSLLVFVSFYGYSVNSPFARNYLLISR